MPTNFAVMTWNLENLFPAGSPAGPRSVEDFEQKLRNLATTIVSIAPDVLAVQEVGDPASLADLQGQLGGHYPHALLSTHPDLRGIRVGFLSQLPLANTEELSEFPGGSLAEVPDGQGGVISHMGRGALKVTVAPTPGLTIDLVTAHLKSKLITYPDSRRTPRDEDERARGTGLALLKRTAEAVALRVYINHLRANNDTPLVLMGDFNDGPEAVTTQLLLGPEDRSLARRDKFDDVRLYNLDDYISADRRFSRIYHNQKELIDHIMVSHELLFTRRQVDSYIEPIESIGESTELRREALFPDHAPVFARFEL